jgi:serine/threonine protein kinase/Flp pilus assembly protein TadD
VIEIGSRIRDIRLTERLGAGGMGQVFVGIDERLGREVAVKALLQERRLDGASRARFQREAQILSRLEHPNICRLYDLVEEEDGEYLVMELVRGKTLREVLVDGLDDTERMRVAEQVAAALVAAHAMTVVHRDLKPENIVVGDNGLVKVLDFGLARRGDTLTIEPAGGADRDRQDEGPADVSTEPAGERVTLLGDVLGTPSYLSPEQARGDVVTAASDMYSLGLLLHELWTGRRPYGPDSGRSELVRKAIWGEIDPPEGIDPEVGALIADLTALDPADRPSATAAAERLRHIRERPRRRAKRRTLIAFILVLVCAAVGSGFGFWRARLAQRQAEEARTEAEAVNDFLSGMLASAAPENEGIDVKVVDILDTAADHVARDFSERPSLQATLQHTLGRAYHSLGRWSEARESFESALASARIAHGSTARITLQIQTSLGVALMRQGELEKAESLLRETWHASQEHLGSDDPDSMAATANLASCLRRLDRNEEALELTRHSYEWKRRELGENHPQTISAQANVANLMYALGRLDEAESLYRDSLQASIDSLGPDHPTTLLNASNLADFLIVMRADYEEAGKPLADLLERRRRVLGAEHPQTLETMMTQAKLLRRTGRYEEAERLLRSILDIRRRTLGDEHPDTVATVASLGIVLRKMGRFEEAEGQLLQALDFYTRTRGEAHTDTLYVIGNLNNVMVDLGRYDRAVDYARRLNSGFLELYGEDHPRTLSSMTNLANTYLARGSLEEAAALVEDAIPRLRRMHGDDHPSTLNARAIGAHILRLRGRFDDAVAEFRAILEARTRTAGTAHPATLQARHDLAVALREGGQPAEADALE